jgi:hypothetical protein
MPPREIDVFISPGKILLEGANVEDSKDLTRELNDMIRGYWQTQAIRVAAELEVANILESGPRTPAEIAGICGADAGALYRVLRALASIGIFAEDSEGRFGLTPLAQVLASSGGQAYALLHGRELYEAWEHMLATVRGGQPAFIEAHGASLFEYMTKNPERGHIFDRAMTGHHGNEARPMLEAYDFSGFGELCDVGGGNGTLLISLLESLPRLRGILFELPAVATRARDSIAASGLSERCGIVGGSFLDPGAIPPGADAYILRHVVHDWNDADSAAILRNCRLAAEPSGRVLVVETVIPSGNEPNFGKWLDLMMLAYGGKERTARQYRALFADAGLELTRIVETAAGISVVEGRPAA